MSPTRWPRSTVWPSAQRQTMRRANSPAICLKVISKPASAPSPRSVTVVLLVALGRSRVHGVEILAFLIVDAAHRAADGRAVDVHIENAQENADALASAFRSGDGCSFCDQAVARRNNQTLAGGDGAMGIAEKPEEKRGQKDRSDAPAPSAGKPHNRRGHG